MPTVEGIELPVQAFAPDYLRSFMSGEQWSDVKDHLPIFLTNGVGNILEIGVRSGVSTSAFLTGTRLFGGKVYGVDIEDCSNIFNDSNWNFIQGDSTTVILPHNWPKSYNCILIDANHDYNYVLSDLNRFAHLSKKVFLHDADMQSVQEAINTFLRDSNLKWSYDYHAGSFGLAILTRE